ncbi:MAG: hypothetical protein AB1813_22895 [Verrucomicrobiota bacterium]
MNRDATNSIQLTPRRGRELAVVIVLRILLCYFVISLVTLPLVDSVWIGELPVLALVQIPKLWLAKFFRKEVVMEVMRAWGLSSGSYSPDLIKARPYGLALAYLSPFAAAAMGARMWWEIVRPHKRMLWVLALLIVADFFSTLLLSDRRFLTLY